MPFKTKKQVITVSPDKSISHRAALLAAAAKGKTKIYNFLDGEDTLNTKKAVLKAGAKITKETKSYFEIQGIKEIPEKQLKINCGNSGTAARLLCGILSGLNINCVIDGDSSLRKRPMKRVTEPLELMGAKFKGKTLPLTVLKNSGIKAINYKMTVASAQVKSALLLAGLYADGKTQIEEIKKTRNHTELMLKYLNASVSVKGMKITLLPSELKARDIFVPNDISSAAFFVVLAASSKSGDFIFKDVGLNPTRSGYLTILKKMGACISVKNKRILNNEAVGDLHVSPSPLKSAAIPLDLIPNIIDEIPILTLAFLKAQGTTVLKGASELRVKESDRINSMVFNLRNCGVKITEYKDGFKLEGGQKLKSGKIKTFMDHRIAMTFLIAQKIFNVPLKLDDYSYIKTSFPSFMKILKEI